LVQFKENEPVGDIFLSAICSVA